MLFKLGGRVQCPLASILCKEKFFLLPMVRRRLPFPVAQLVLQPGRIRTSESRYWHPDGTHRSLIRAARRDIANAQRGRSAGM